MEACLGLCSFSYIYPPYEDGYIEKLLPCTESLSYLREQRIEEAHKYVRWVDKAVSSHKADIINEFRVQFYLKENSKETIDNWLRFAMEKRVKRLELDIALNSWHMFLPRPFSYNLPSLSPGAPLTSLQLNFVDVTGEVLEKLLHDYPSLESVSVVSSRSLVNLKVVGPDLNLKSLQLRHCLKMEHLEITAPNLISFDYAGPFVLSWDFISTPKLAELSIGGMYGSHILENFMDFSSIFSQIDVLSIEAEDPLFPLMNGFSTKFPVGRRLKMLDISFSVKFEYDLFFIGDLLLACPLLQKFVLQGSTVECIDLSNDESTKMLEYWDIRDNEACPHESLKIVEMTRFGGTEAELRFVEYLTKSAFSVENIIIKVDCRGEEPFDEAMIRAREELASEKAKRLHTILKPGLHLDIL